MASFFLFFGVMCTYNKSCFRLVFVMLPYIIFRWWTSFFWLFLSYLYFLVFISYFLQCFKFFISANSSLPAPLFLSAGLFSGSACVKSLPTPPFLLPPPPFLLPLSHRCGLGGGAWCRLAPLKGFVPAQKSRHFHLQRGSGNTYFIFFPKSGILYCLLSSA